MNLLGLRYFCTVAQKKNVTAAAQSLHVSQPAVSKMLRGLEQELGTELLRKTSSGVELTEKGRIFYDKISEAINLLDEGVRITQKPPFSDTKICRVFSMVNSKFLPDLYLSFKKAYPDIRLELRHISSSLFPDDADFDFLILPDSHLPPHYDSTPLLQEDFFLALPVGHELAAKESVMLEELTAYDFIMMESSAATYQYFLALCHSAHFHPHIAMECDSSTTLLKFLQAGYGITILPEYSHLSKENHILLTKISQPHCFRTIALCWSNESSLKGTGEIFVDFCKSFFADYKK